MKRLALALLAVVVLLPLAAVLGGGAMLDSAPVRARVADAVQRATGHPLRIDGGIGIAWSLTPAIAMRDVALLNPPGFSRPAFGRLARIEASLALLPLLSGRVEIRSVTLERPDILLERDAAGRGNWLPPAAPPPSAPAPPSAPSPRMAIEVASVQITGARIAWGAGLAATIPSLRFAPSGGPVEGRVALNGVEFTLKGQSGAMLSAPVPLDITATGGGLALAVSGQAGGALAMQLLAPDLAATSVLAGRPMPALKDVKLTGQLGPTGLGALRLTAGVSDLAPGLRLAALTVDAPALDQPLKLTAEATYRALPIAFAFNIARLSALMGAAPVAFQALLAADGATIGMQGSAQALNGQGLQAQLTARIPDLQRLGALAGLALPPAANVALDTQIAPSPDGVALANLRLSTPQGEITGDLTAGLSPTPFLRGALSAQTLDLDAGPPAAAAPPPPTAAASPAPPAEAPTQTRLIPDRPLPFALLRLANADLRLTIAQMQLRGAPYRAIEAHLTLQNGRLQIDPAHMQSPGGPLHAVLRADAAATPPTAGLIILAPGLDAAGLAAALGAPGAATGTADLDIDLRAAGPDPRAMAATLAGRIGLALVDGDIDNQLLTTLFGAALRSVSLPIDTTGRSRVRCLALRIDSTAGQAALKTLALDATRLKLDGEGALDLVTETMDLRLRPILRLGPTALAVPVRLSGPFTAPRPQPDKGVIAPGRFGISIGGAAPDTCGPALTAARDGKPGTMPR